MIEQQIAQALLADYQASGFKSHEKYARSVAGITKTDMSNIANGRYLTNPQLISKSKWARIARAINFNLDDTLRIATAQTAVYKNTLGLLSLCRELRSTVIMVDEPGIGKTHTCREFAQKNKGEVFYINCSDWPNKTRLVEELARVLGLDQELKTEDTYQNCVRYINYFLENPMIILDEAGDLDHTGLIMIKRLYNATENHLAVFMVGSDGLQNKFERGKKLRKNGYTELISRMGGTYKRTSPRRSEGSSAFVQFMMEQSKNLCQANGIDFTDEIADLVYETPDLRNVVRQIRKLRYKINKKI